VKQVKKESKAADKKGRKVAKKIEKVKTKANKKKLKVAKKAQKKVEKLKIKAKATADPVKKAALKKKELKVAPKAKKEKGKVKDKLMNAVLFDKTTYDKLMKEIPKKKLITTATVSAWWSKTDPATSCSVSAK